MEKYLYYPGCTLKTYASSYELSALAIAKTLGLELVELDKWYCCGAVASLAQDDLFRYLGPIRTLVKAQEHSNKVVTLCDMCYNTLQHANLLLKKNPQSLDTINSFIEPDSYKGKVEVYHLLQVLRDFVTFEKLKGFIKQPLNIKLAPYYGCMLLRPRELAIDEPEEPSVLEDLIIALGGEVVNSIYRTECCGSYNIVDNKELVSNQVSKILYDMKDKGCEAIITSCPLCKYNLEHSKEKIPVFYFTQLIAIAFKLPEEYYGLVSHKIDPKHLLKTKNLLR
ncbi:MAG: CoB--CoM heterodisulfide reductase iron-sulfur subunit B family protein [Candidatus Thermoplasmatota archaeon]|nr:CoB--CoM heterodisulfide reductase iron-sulfur subunit B family protein [Candidatus Thermoplasmatota archaeon]